MDIGGLCVGVDGGGEVNERKRLDRLVKDGKVVGYQKQEGGRIYHLPQFYLERVNYSTKARRNNRVDDINIGLAWNDVYKIRDQHYPDQSRIPHDRIDQYTGVDVDGVKVFEREQYTDTVKTFNVIFQDGCFHLSRTDNGCLRDILEVQEMYFIGIQGATIMTNQPRQTTPGCVGCVSISDKNFCAHYNKRVSLSKEALPCGRKTHSSYCKWCDKIVKDRVIDPEDINEYYHDECKKINDEYASPYERGASTGD